VPNRRISNVAWAVFWVWAGLSFCTLATTSDLWVHFRIGQDILAGKGFLTVEEYSATAEGRPFIAYEWLSAVLLQVLYEVAGSPGLMMLRLSASVACLAFLYFALAPSLRTRATVLPLLMLTTYLVCFRAHLRPHLFSLVAVSALCFALERWRRTRRLRDIVWLVPMHALWANLHGAYLFGIVILGVVAGLVGFFAFVSQQPTRYEAPYSRGDFLRISSVAVGSLLACGVNPYGTALFELSFRMSESSDFIKASIGEWMDSFAVGPGNLWFGVYCVVLAVFGLCTLMRLRDRRWLDVVLAVLVIFQSMRANRFIPHMAIFGFPIMVRWMDELSDRGFGLRALRLRPWLDVALIVVMLATSVGPGSQLGPRHRRQLGWGFASHYPFEEVEYIRSHALEGVVYNEYADGGFIIHSLYPKVRPIMDPRIDVYGPELYAEWQRSRRETNAFLAYLEKYEIELLLLRRGRENRKLLAALRRQPDWRFVRKFERRVLYVRSGASSADAQGSGQAP
jgi:hypothetical protein